MRFTGSLFQSLTVQEHKCSSIYSVVGKMKLATYLVHCSMEYEAAVWNPHHVWNIQELKKAMQSCKMDT